MFSGSIPQVLIAGESRFTLGCIDRIEQLESGRACNVLYPSGLRSYRAASRRRSTGPRRANQRSSQGHHCTCNYDPGIFCIGVIFWLEPSLVVAEKA